MNPDGRIDVLVLAAGRSSRMGVSKPLLRLGPLLLIGRVVDAVSRAAVRDVVIVTGHNPDEIRAAVAGLPVRLAHNPEYDSGMFSSIRTGAKALLPDLEGFFVLPVDCPLVASVVLDRLIAEFREGGREPLHPTCCGLRGHPPLLPGRYREALLHADDGCDLQSFLDNRPEGGLEVEVTDPAILMDMDTTADYERIVRFAALRDAASAFAMPTETPSTSGALDGSFIASEDALYLHSLLETPDRVVRHCRVVAEVGGALVAALRPKQPNLDAGLVRTGCLLHDLAKLRPRHAAVGETLLVTLGLNRLGSVVGAHMVLPPEQLQTPVLTEEQLVYLADKLVIDDRVVSLETKVAQALRRRSADPAALAGARARMHAARIVYERVESVLGRPVEEVLSRLRLPST